MVNLETDTRNDGQGGLIDAPRLLEQIFPNPDCRPSVRWLRTQVANRTLPFCRVGRLVYFDPVQVREHLTQRAAKACRSTCRSSRQ